MNRKPWYVRHAPNTQYWHCKIHYNAKQKLVKLLDVFKEYCRCGKKCCNFVCNCGNILDSQDEAEMSDLEDNNQNVCNCRCDCVKCNSCFIYTDINSILCHLGVFLSRTYCMSNKMY